MNTTATTTLQSVDTVLAEIETTKSARTRKPRITVPNPVKVSPVVEGHGQHFTHPVRGITVAGCTCGWTENEETAILDGSKYVDARRAHNVHKAQLLGVNELIKNSRTAVLKAHDVADVVLTEDEIAAITAIYAGALERVSA